MDSKDYTKTEDQTTYETNTGNEQLIITDKKRQTDNCDDVKSLEDECKQLHLVEDSTNKDQEISGVVAEATHGKNVSAPSPGGAGDTSITDDEIEVICLYTSPKFDKIENLPLPENAEPNIPLLCEHELSEQEHPMNNMMMGMEQEVQGQGFGLCPEEPMIPHGYPIPDTNGQVPYFINHQPMAPFVFYPPIPMMAFPPNCEQQLQEVPDTKEDDPTIVTSFQPPRDPQNVPETFVPSDPNQALELHQPSFIPQQGIMPLFSRPVSFGDPANPGYPPMPNYQDYHQGVSHDDGLLHSTDPAVIAMSPSHHTSQLPAQEPPYFYPNSGQDAFSSFQASTGAATSEFQDTTTNVPQLPMQQEPPYFYPNSGQDVFSSFQASTGAANDVSQDTTTNVYPSIYVSTSGMITILLRFDISIEMTVDRTIRVVNHTRKMALATNSRGTSSILHHPAAKVYQENTKTDAEVSDVKVKMMTENIFFGSGTSNYKFDYNYIEAAIRPGFADLSMDKSVNLLFASESFGSTLVDRCMFLAGTAEYENLPKGGVIIRINGIKIIQNGRGDVSVVSGPKFMKLSPGLGYVRLNTHFTEMSVDKDGVLRMRRGNHTIDSSNNRVILSNGKIEAGLDHQGRLKVYTLPKRAPLEVTRDQRKPRPGNQRRKATARGGYVHLH